MQKLSFDILIEVMTVYVFYLEVCQQDDGDADPTVASAQAHFVNTVVPVLLEKAGVVCGGGSEMEQWLAKVVDAAMEARRQTQEAQALQAAQDRVAADPCSGLPPALPSLPLGGRVGAAAKTPSRCADVPAELLDKQPWSDAVDNVFRTFTLLYPLPNIGPNISAQVLFPIAERWVQASLPAVEAKLRSLVDLQSRSATGASASAGSSAPGSLLHVEMNMFTPEKSSNMVKLAASTLLPSLWEGHSPFPTREFLILLLTSYRYEIGAFTGFIDRAVVQNAKVLAAACAPPANGRQGAPAPTEQDVLQAKYLLYSLFLLAFRVFQHNQAAKMGMVDLVFGLLEREKRLEAGGVQALSHAAGQSAGVEVAQAGSVCFFGGAPMRREIHAQFFKQFFDILHDLLKDRQAFSKVALAGMGDGGESPTSRRACNKLSSPSPRGSSGVASFFGGGDSAIGTASVGAKSGAKAKQLGRSGSGFLSLAEIAFEKLRMTQGRSTARIPRAQVFDRLAQRRYLTAEVEVLLSTDGALELQKKMRKRVWMILGSSDAAAVEAMPFKLSAELKSYLFS